jgi:hypothetical protein
MRPLTGLCALLLAIVLLGCGHQRSPPASPAPASTNQLSTTPTNSPSDSTSWNSSNTHGKTVHVSGYTRKDGTYVPPYTRRPPSR